MNKIYTSIICLLFCTTIVAQNKMALHGEYQGAQKGDILSLYDPTSKADIDSALVKNGKFTFKMQNIQPGEYVLKHNANRREALLLYLDNYDTNIVIGDSFKKASVTGNPTHIVVSNLNEKLMYADAKELFVPFAQTRDLLKNVAERKDMASAMVLDKYLEVYYVQFSMDEIKQLYDGLVETAKQSIAGKNFYKKFDQKYTSIVRFKKGAVLPDFTLNTPDGKPITLSQFVKGKKAVLVDFWASWCAPCRAKNPELRMLLQDYKDQGLDVLAVSIDKDAKNWKQAIKDDQVTWTQVSDLKERKSPVFQAYYIDATGVPLTFLVDENCRILENRDSGLGDHFRDTIEKYFHLNF